MLLRRRYGDAMTSGAGPFVRIRGLGKCYGSVEALRDVSLDARLGEILAIVGTNGAGKSTLVKMISGVLGPDKGHLGHLHHLAPLPRQQQ